MLLRCNFINWFCVWWYMAMGQTYIGVVYMYRGHRKIMGVILHRSLDYYLETGSPHPTSPHIITSPPSPPAQHTPVLGYECLALCECLLGIWTQILMCVCAAPCWDFNKDGDPRFPTVLLPTVIPICFLPAPRNVWHYFLGLVLQQYLSDHHINSRRTCDAEEGEECQVFVMVSVIFFLEKSSYCCSLGCKQ